MKIPRTLKIGGKKIRVVVHISNDVDDVEDIGEWDGHYYIIQLDKLKNAPIERIEECFLHEIIEAINGLYELNLSHWKINTLSEVLYQIIKDNKLDFD